MNQRLLLGVAAALVAVGGWVSFVVNKATEGHPAVRRAVYSVENEATKLLRRGFAATGRCGVQRWDEKTLSSSDPASAQVLISSPLKISVPVLRAAQLPSWSGPTGPAPSGPRIAQESTSFRLAGTWLIAYKLELDSDIHLELQSAIDSTTMIAEIPDPGCVSNLEAKTRITAARLAFVTEVGTPVGYYTDTHLRVSLTGPAFWDFVHGQAGVAPSGVEIHPVLSFRRW